MKMIALIDDNEVVKENGRHLGLWSQESLPAREPPSFLLFIPYIRSKVFCMQTISIDTQARTQFVDIKAKVADAVKDARFMDGMVNVFVPHTTAGVTIND